MPASFNPAVWTRRLPPEVGLVFIIGAPRSGTTWLHAMLGGLPQVATTVELSLFQRYVPQWYESWRFEEEVLAARGVPQGLRHVITREELEGFLESFVHFVYLRVLEKKPQASVLVDKQPGYAPYVAVIHRMFPCAHFIHMLRDGRDVTVSLRTAGRAMAFGPITASTGAQVWVKAVTAARQARDFGDRFIEVRYEDLLANPRGVLAEVVRRCGISATSRELETVAAGASFAQMKQRRATADPAVPAHPLHYQRGVMGRWKEELTVFERLEVERLAGPLLRELGYAQPGWWAEAAWQRLVFPPLARVGRGARRLAAAVLGGRAAAGPT